LKTPVAFLIFNRPDRTERVFAEIAKARPPKLLVVADGPRTSLERETCQAARAIIDRVDWDCEVLKNYADVNLGCKRRVSSGIDWVFEQVEEAIILEDDCLPHADFFPFCEEMLERFRDNERVAMVCGANFLHHQVPIADSYYFGHYGHIWGWATWRRAWQDYDVSMKSWAKVRSSEWLRELLNDKYAARHWKDAFDRTYHGQMDTWDYQWLFAWWVQRHLAVVSATNLISNIGYGDEATHTKGVTSTAAAVPVEPPEWPLRHPADLASNDVADRFAFSQFSPWAIPEPGPRGWLRYYLAPHLPSSIRRLLTRSPKS
jgi:hypothetical protein